MSANNDAMEKFGRMIDRLRPVNAPTRGKVVSVDESNKTCKVTFADGRASHDSVRLTAAADSSVIIYPATDSIVLVAFADNKLTSAYITAVSHVSKIVLTTAPGKKLELQVSDDGATVTISKGKITLTQNGTTIGDGAAEPMVKGQSLSSWAASVDAALTAIIAWGATGVAPGPQGGIAPLAGVTPSAFASNILSQENKVS